MRAIRATLPLFILTLLSVALPHFSSKAYAATPQTQPETRLAGVTRILFLGDSITYAGQYVDDIETQLLLRYPKRKFEIINCGLSSETVSGLSEPGHAGGKFPRPDLHERLDRVLAKVKPDLVFACYGMNDGIYLPLADDRFDAFKNGMKKLHEKVLASGATIIHLTPPVFDPVPIHAKVAPADKCDVNHPFEGYDGVLSAYGKWLLAQEKAAGWAVVDIHGPMSASIAEQRKNNRAFTFSGDGVHPNAAGHAVMASAVLNAIDTTMDPSDDRFGMPSDRKSKYAQVHKLVHDRGRILIDAWLTDIGHKRPMKPGLPLDEAREKVAPLTKQIETLLEQTK